VLTGFVLVPVLAWLGFAERDGPWPYSRDSRDLPQQIMAESRPPSPSGRAQLQQIEVMLFRATWILLAATLLARGAREYASRRRETIRLRYPEGKSAVVPLGWTVLEASRAAGIPHASVCGGRGRCSTCRVRVAGDPGVLPPPSPQELRVLQRVGAPPNVRLACQLRPHRDLEVTPASRGGGGRGCRARPHGSAQRRGARDRRALRRSPRLSPGSPSTGCRMMSYSS
jgi:adenylate cyclase